MMLGLRYGLRFLVGSLILHRRAIAFYAFVGALIVLGALLTGLGEALEHQYPDINWRLIEEIGKALLVAGILAGTVDLYLKRRLASDFVRDVAPYIEGLGLPQEFQDEIAFIRRIEIYRRDLRIRYRIERLAPPLNGYVKILTTTSFEVVNATDVAREYTFDASCEDAYPEAGQSKILSMGGEGPGVERFTFSKTDETIDRLVQRQGPLLRCEHAVAVRPQVGPNIFWSEMESYEEENGSDIFYFSIPTVNVTIEVEAPADFEVEVFIGHRFQEEEPPRIRLIPPAPERTHTWKISAAMLTWHSVYIRWKGARAARGTGGGAPVEDGPQRGR